MTMLRTARLAVLVSLLSAAACATEVLEPLPVAELQAAPTSLTVGTGTIVLDPYLWRDFMPIAPADGQPLVAVIRLKTGSGSAYGGNAEIDRVWVVNGSGVWTAQEIESRQAATAEYEVAARNGPKWGPGINVDVVVRIQVGGVRSLLRMSNVPIHRTD
jgi:opacity protein-like surface antigen